MNKKILLSHINYYQVKKGFFRNRLPGPQTTWPRVSSGMRKLIVFTEGLLSLDVELTQAQRIRLLHILRYLKENGKKKLTGQIFDDLQGRLTIRHSNVPPRVLSHNIITNSLTGETHLSTIEEIELTQDEQIIYLKEGNLILNDLVIML